MKPRLLLLIFLFSAFSNVLLAVPSTLDVYTGADAFFNLYEDEGTNYNYEKGAFSTIPMKYNEATNTITIDARKGSFNGMLEKRIFRINIISPNNAKHLDFDASDKEATYEGNKITIKIGSFFNH